MGKSLSDWLKVAEDLKVVVDDLKKAKADGKVTIDEGIGLAAEVLAVLAKHNVSIAELSDLVRSLGPLIGLVKAKF